MGEAKKYTDDEISSSNEFIDRPSSAVFTIEKETADRILELQKLCIDNKLSEVRVSDHRTYWLKSSDVENPEDPDDPDYQDPETLETEDLDANTMRVECEYLCVDDLNFQFVCMDKYSPTEFSTSYFLISEMAAHFGLQAHTRQPN